MESAIKCKDHLGNEFNTLTEMCEHWNIKADVVSHRLCDGWDIKRALTQPVHKITVRDHLGNVYSSIDKMLESYGINKNVYYNRITTLGWNKEQALTTPVNSNGHYDGKITFHGKQYRSLSELCDCYRISYGMVESRLKRGWDLEKSIQPKLASHSNWQESIDHKGNKYPSFKRMCEQYNQCPSVVKRRLSQGLSLQEALEKPTNRHAKQQYIINGKTYDSFKSVCRDYGLDPTTVHGRMKRKNISLEEALYSTTPNKIEVTDFKGNFYSSYNEMYKAYGITKHIAKARKNNGWNEENVLLPREFSPQRWFKYHCIKAIEICVDDNGVPFFQTECINCKLKKILTPQQIIEHVKQHG